MATVNYCTYITKETMTDEDKTLASTAGENVELNSAQEPSGSNANEILTSGGINENKMQIFFLFDF